LSEAHSVVTPTGSELSGLRLARISWVIGLALTAVFLSYKVVQLLLTPAVIDGASGITGPEMLVALVSLFSVVPIAAGIVLAHVAISRGALADLRARTHALFGLVAGYFFLACLILNVAFGLLGSAVEPATVHSSFLVQLFYALG